MNEGSRSRRAARRARQRRRRRNTALGLTAGLLAVAAAVWLVTGRGGGPADTADATPSHSGRTPAGTAVPAAPSTAAAPAGRAEAAGTITLAFAGDVHFTGRTAGRLGADPALGPMTPVLSAADFAMVNLESAITERGVPQPKTYHFRTTPQALDALRRSGIDAVTMANNHSVDYGAQGLADSIDAKHHAPIPVVGIGADDTEAYRPYVTTVNGVRLAV